MKLNVQLFCFQIIMDEILKQKLITAIKQENLSEARDCIPYLSSVSTAVKLKDIVSELVDNCLCKKFKITRLLIQEILRLKNEKVFGLEFLKKAIEKGDVEAVKELINQGVDIHNFSYCFLHVAIEYKRLDIAELLLAKKSNVYKGPINTPALYWAVKLNYVQGVEFLFNNGANLTNSSFESFSPIHAAAYYGSLDCIKFFCDRGADINQMSKIGTPLGIATKNNFVDCVTYLSNHPNINQSLKIASLDTALSTGKEECGLAIINSGCDIFARMNYNNFCSIHAAAQGNCVNAIKLLLKRGVDVNLSTSDNRQPLHFAVSKGHLESAELLLNHGAYIDLN